jgi:hypothetical protein
MAYSKSNDPTEIAAAHADILTHVVLRGKREYNRYLLAARQYASDHGVVGVPFKDYEEMILLRWEMSNPCKVPAASLYNATAASPIAIEVIQEEVKPVEFEVSKRVTDGVGNTMPESRSQKFLSRALARTANRVEFEEADGVPGRVQAVVASAVSGAFPMQMHSKPSSQQKIMALPTNDPAMYALITPNLVTLSPQDQQNVDDAFTTIKETLEGVTSCPKEETAREKAFNTTLKAMRAVVALKESPGPLPNYWTAIKEWAVPTLINPTTSQQFGHSVDDVLDGMESMNLGRAALGGAIGLAAAGAVLGTRVWKSRQHMQRDPEAGHEGAYDARPPTNIELNGAYFGLNRSRFGPPTSYDQRIQQDLPLEIVQIAGTTTKGTILYFKKFDFWNPESTGELLNQKTAFHEFITGKVNAVIEIQNQVYNSGSLACVPLTAINQGDVTEATTYVDPVQVLSAVPVANTQSETVGDASSLSQVIDLSRPGKFRVSCPITTSGQSVSGATTKGDYVCGFFLCAVTDLTSAVKDTPPPISVRISANMSDLVLHNNVVGKLKDASPADGSNPYRMTILTKKAVVNISGSVTTNQDVPPWPQGTIVVDGKSKTLQKSQDHLSAPHYGNMRFDTDATGAMLAYGYTYNNAEHKTIQKTVNQKILRDIQRTGCDGVDTFASVDRLDLEASGLDEETLGYHYVSVPFGYNMISTDRKRHSRNTVMSLAEDLNSMASLPIPTDDPLTHLPIDSTCGDPYIRAVGPHVPITSGLVTFHTLTAYDSPSVHYRGEVPNWSGVTVMENPGTDQCTHRCRPTGSSEGFKTELKWENLSIKTCDPESEDGLTGGLRPAYHRLGMHQYHCPGRRDRAVNMGVIKTVALTPGKDTAGGSQLISDLRSEMDYLPEEDVVGQYDTNYEHGIDDGLILHNPMHYALTPVHEPTGYEDCVFEFGRTNGLDAVHYGDLALSGWGARIIKFTPVRACVPQELKRDVTPLGSGLSVMEQVFSPAPVKMQISGTPVATTVPDADPSIPAGYNVLQFVGQDELVPTVLQGATGSSMAPNDRTIRFTTAVAERLNRDNFGSYLYTITTEGRTMYVVANRTGAYIKTSRPTPMHLIQASAMTARVVSVQRQADAWACPETDVSGLLERDISSASPQAAYKPADSSEAIYTNVSPDKLQRWKRQAKWHREQVACQMEGAPIDDLKLGSAGMAAFGALGGAITGGLNAWTSYRYMNKYFADRQADRDNRLAIAKMQGRVQMGVADANNIAEMQREHTQIRAQYANMAGISTAMTGHSGARNTPRGDPPPYSEADPATESDIPSLIPTEDEAAQRIDEKLDQPKAAEVGAEHPPAGPASQQATTPTEHPSSGTVGVIGGDIQQNTKTGEVFDGSEVPIDPVERATHQEVGRQFQAGLDDLQAARRAKPKPAPTSTGRVARIRDYVAAPLPRSS